MPPLSQEQWLENIEERFFTSFEAVKCVFLEIVQEALDRPKKIPNELDGEALLKENKLLQMKCQEMETENKRFTKQVNAKMETWNKNFQILKKKYRQLQQVNENNHNKNSKYLNRSKEESSQKLRNEIRIHEIAINKNIKDVDLNKIGNVSGVFDEVVVENNCEKGKKSSCKSMGNILEADSQTGVTESGLQTKGLSSEENSSWEGKNIFKMPMKDKLSKHQDSMRNKRKIKVKYHENTSQKSQTDSHNSQSKILGFKGGKRQSRKSNHELDIQQRVKERKLSPPEHKVLIIESQPYSSPESSPGESNIDNNNKDQLFSKSKSHAKADSVFQTPRIPLPDTSRKGSCKSAANNADETIWHPEDQGGSLFVASTPVTDTSVHRDFDETMWSAPRSPAIVRSMLSTPEKIEISSSPESKAKINKSSAKSPLKCPRIKLAQKFETQGMESPCLFESDQSRGSNQMTSNADLSDDLFHGMGSGKSFDYDDSPKEHGHQDGMLDQKEYLEKVDPDFDSSYLGSFERRRKDDINNGIKYKYNAVVRKRGERDKMEGYQCPECAAWYEDEDNDEDKKNHLKHVCRHKAVSSPPPATPNGFWSLGFPDTQECLKKGYMLNENVSIPNYAKPKPRNNKQP